MGKFDFGYDLKYQQCMIDKTLIIEKLIIGQTYSIKHPAFSAVACGTDYRIGRCVDIYNDYIVFDILAEHGHYKYAIEIADIMSGRCELKEREYDK